MAARKLLFAAVGVALIACAQTRTPHTRVPIAGEASPETLDTPIAEDGMGVTIHRLNNGLTVYISTDRQKPTIDAWVAVRAGSRHDPADSTGLAHYLEHMLFKGSDELGTLDYAKELPHLKAIEAAYAKLESAPEDERAAIFAEIDAETQASAKYAVPNEIDSLYARMGITGVNAFTSFDQTVYIASVPSNRFSAWAEVEAERFVDVAFRLFYPELEAVYEEKNLSLDRPGSRVFETLLRAAFPEHPYGTQPTIGLSEHLKTPAYGDMVEYFKRWYVPNNIAIALAGDVDPQTALPVLEKAFGRWQSTKPLDAPRDASLTPPKGRVHHSVKAPGTNSVTLAWRTVGAGAREEATMIVLDALMDNAQSGLLNTELELPQKVPSASAFNLTMREAGLWVMSGEARKDQSAEEVEALLLGVLDKLRAGEFTEEDVDAVAVHDRISRMREQETTGSRVAAMADAFVTGRQWRDVVALEAEIAKVTKADVVAAANRFLGNDFVSVWRVPGEYSPPKIPKPTITPVPIDSARRSPFAERVEALPVTPVEAKILAEGQDFVSATLPGGPLLAVANQRNKLFTLAYEFERGYRSEPLLCHAMDLWRLSGAGDLDATALQKQLYGLGSSVRLRCNADESTLVISGLDENLEPTLALVDRWLREPKYGPDDVARLRDTTLSARKDMLEEPAYLRAAVSGYARFGKDSAWLALPSNQSIEAADGEALGKLIRSFPDHQHRTSYFGPRDAKAAAQVVSLGRAHAAVAERPARRYRKVKNTKLVILDRDQAKSDVVVAMPQGALTREDRPRARLYSEYLGGGMNALVFQEIREARGLAYSATAWVDRGRRPQDQPTLSGRLATQADKTPEALKVLLELLCERPVDPARVATAQSSLEERSRTERVDVRDVADYVWGWRERGDQADPRPWLREQVRQLDANALGSYAGVLAKAPVVIGIVGSIERIGRASLEKLGSVEVVEPAALFSFGPFPQTKTKPKTDAAK